MGGSRTASSGIRRERSAPERARWPACGTPTMSLLACSCLAVILTSAAPASAASNNVRITGLTDVAFGTLASLSSDASRSQSVCVYANTATAGYNVRASGSGPGGAFALTSGSNSLPFEVQWSSAAGQGAGTQLTANVALPGQTSSASQQTCNSGPASSASLIVILRSAALSGALAGSYNGSLTIVIGPE